MERALGDLYAGVFGNDDAWRDEVVAAGEASGDHAWPWPMHRRYRRVHRVGVRGHEELVGPRPGDPRLRRVVPRGVRRRGPLGARGHGRDGLLHAGARNDYLWQKGGTGYGVRLIVELAERLAAMNFDLSRGARARPEHRARLRRGSVSRRSPRSSTASTASPTSSSAELAELGLMGMPIPEEYGGGRHRHALLRDRGRGADADRLLGRDHDGRAHVARHDADLPLRERGAEARVAARPRLGAEACRVRPDRAGRGLRRRGTRARVPSCTTASG